MAEPRAITTKLGVMTASPWAFLVLLAFSAAWLVFERDTFDWHGVATLATFAMTLFIQRAEHRDTQAIQAKLDELLKASSQADDRVSRIDEQEPEAIEAHRAARN